MKILEPLAFSFRPGSPVTLLGGTPAVVVHSLCLCRRDQTWRCLVETDGGVPWIAHFVAGVCKWIQATSWSNAVDEALTFAPSN